MSTSTQQLTIVSIYPTLLGTYGDGGNVLALAHRARLRGYEVTTVSVAPGEAVPASADLYVLGGGEDTAQTAAARALIADGGLARAAAGGSPIFAVCAGYQLLGHAFPTADDSAVAGLGLLDVSTNRLPRRAVGEVSSRPSPHAPDGLDNPLLGYENHAGQTTVGPGASPLGIVTHGVGNGDGTEGAITGRTLGTYLHGPCLARNPRLADLLLSWAIGVQLDDLVEPEVEQLRAERLRFLAEH